MSFLAAVYMTVSLSRPAFHCRPLPDLLRELLAEKHAAYLSDFTDSHDNVLMIFINVHTGQWYEIGVLPDAKTACIVMEGYDWHFAMEKSG